MIEAVARAGNTQALSSLFTFPQFADPPYSYPCCLDFNSLFRG